jgi:hypothetical protein
MLRTSRPARSLLLAALALCTALPPLRAQSPAARAITTQPTEFAEPFSSITRIVELADRRVLLNDNIEKTLGVADFVTGEFTAVARQGAGPLEYQTVFNLLRVPGDSVMLWDMGNRRTLVLASDGTPVRTSTLAGSGNPMAMISQPIPRESDAHGRLYALFTGMGSAGGMQRADSTALVRLASVTGTVDTLLLIAAPPGAGRMLPETSSGAMLLRSAGFPTRNAWGVFPDGRVLFIHGERYQPEIILPDGTRRLAAVVPFPSIPVTAKDKDNLMKTHREQVGRMRIAAPPGATPPRFEAAEPERWQTHMPPLLSDVVRVDSRARAWVRVSDRDPDAGERYDLLDAEGKRVDAVRLPRGLTLVAMGAGVFYATREDEDGLVYLRRFALP